MRTLTGSSWWDPGRAVMRCRPGSSGGYWRPSVRDCSCSLGDTGEAVCGVTTAYRSSDSWKAEEISMDVPGLSQLS